MSQEIQRNHRIKVRERIVDKMMRRIREEIARIKKSQSLSQNPSRKAQMKRKSEKANKNQSLIHKLNQNLSKIKSVPFYYYSIYNKNVVNINSLFSIFFVLNSIKILFGSR